MEMAVYQKPWISSWAIVLSCDWPIHTATQLGKRLPPSVIVQSETSLPKVCSFLGSRTATSPILTPPAPRSVSVQREMRFFWQPRESSMP